LPRRTLEFFEFFVHDLSLVVITQYFHTDTAGATRIDLVFVVKHRLPSKTVSIIEHALRQHSDRGTLACVYVASDGHTQVNDFVDGRVVSNQDFANPTLLI